MRRHRLLAALAIAWCLVGESDRSRVYGQRPERPQVMMPPRPVAPVNYQAAAQTGQDQPERVPNSPAESLGSVPGGQQWLPFPAAQPMAENLQIASPRADVISLTAKDAPLSGVLALIAEQHGLNIVTGSEMVEQITVKLLNTQLEDALDAILSTNGYAWTRQKNIILISKIAGENKSSAAVQGRMVQVFNLNYVSAVDIDKVVQGLLSPVGKSFTNQSLPTDHRRTHEQLIVEDLPAYLNRIAQYVQQVDAPPLQVQLEAHVLQVTLKDNSRHGVNFSEILQMAHLDITTSTVGLASSTATPTSMVRLQGGDLDSLLEAIKATTDAKTLASPKVTVLNNQEAHLQVGAKIGYLLTATTQTSTLQSVNFLDVGVILKVLPSITRDGQVLIKVAPQVSTGRINATTQLPESETTEVDTQVLLADGEAIVIGGLIKETDNDSRNKVPILGDLWLVGWLFQRRETVRERNEIIITLVPRIVPANSYCRDINPEDLQQAHTPLLVGPLQPVDRTAHEARLPNYSMRLNERPRVLGAPVHSPAPAPATYAPPVMMQPIVSEPAVEYMADPSIIQRSPPPGELLNPDTMIIGPP